MFKHLFPLALQSTVRKRRSSLLVFAVLLLSVACSILSLSLVESMDKTNEGIRFDAYGEWYLAVPGAKSGDDAWFFRQNWAQSVGTVRTYGYVRKGLSAFGTVDGAYRALSHIKLLSGRLPEAEGEVALTESALRSIGCEQYEIGQEVFFSFAAYYKGEDQLALSDSAAFTLCGVIKDYGGGWALEQNKRNAQVVEAIVTEETAQKVYSALSAVAYGPLEPPATQCYVSVAREKMEEASAAAARYMSTTRGKASWDVEPCVNLLAYPIQERAVSSSDLYALLIAVVALAAVLCVYMMQLPSEVHSFSILRSIGITRPQLLALSFLESAILAAPAMLLGIPLGAALTGLSLRILMYSGSETVQVVIPFSALGRLFLLWLAVIVLARLVIFLLVVRTPLTGKMQLSPRRARRTRYARRAVVVLLLAVLGVTVIYTAAKAMRGVSLKEFYADAPPYRVYSMKGEPLTQELRRTIESLPGVEYVERYCQMKKGKAGVSFGSTPEQPAALYMIEMHESEKWSETLPLDAADAAAFEAGEFILLCLPEGDASPLPTGDVVLHAYNDAGACVAEVSTPVRIRYIPFNAPTRSRVMVREAYTVVCSDAFVRRVHAAMPSGAQWSHYVGGEAYCEYALLILTAGNAEQLSAGAAIEMLCRAEHHSFSNDYEATRDLVLSNNQELILLYACGGCVALVTLLLLMSALAMEAEQEKRSFSILRVIGMSKRQMQRKVFGKALLRGGLAVLTGLVIYAGLSIRSRMTALAVPFADAVPAAWRAFTYYGGSLGSVVLLSFALLALLLLASLIAKRSLRESARLK